MTADIAPNAPAFGRSEAERRLRQAHAHSFENRKAIEASGQAGCFYCESVFPAAEVTAWLHDKGGDTAQCPRCTIDAVIGDASGFALTPAFLREMKARWF